MNTSRGRPPQKTGLHRDLKTLAYIVTTPFSTPKTDKKCHFPKKRQVLNNGVREMAFIISSCELIIQVRTFRPMSVPRWQGTGR